MTALGRAIRKARSKHSWSQRELAERIGVSQATISHWERGEEYPSFAHLAVLGSTLPEVLAFAHEEELDLLRRLLRAERVFLSGACSCKGCGCGA